MSVPYTSDYRKKARRRQILDLALKDVWVSSRKEHREIYALLHKQGYDVAGYAGRLENALKYVRRAETAINALEGNE